MASIDRLLDISTQFKQASATIKATQKLMTERTQLLTEQSELASNWIRKQPERQAELLAAADAKLGTAVVLGEESITQVRAAVAALRADGDAVPRHLDLADTIERHLARQIAGGLELHPSAPPAEAFTQNIHGTVGYWRLTDRLDETAATIQAEHVILAGT